MKVSFQTVMTVCFAWLCLGLASCTDDAVIEASQEQEVTGQPFTLTAHQSTPSRLALGEDGLTVLWDPGDILYLINKDTKAKIKMVCNLEEPAISADFTSEGGVPAGDYLVVYNYNEQMVYEHQGLSSIEDINNGDGLALWGNLTISEGDDSAEIILNHIYAKVRVVLKNAPENIYAQVGMYASKGGFPIRQQLTNNGMVNVNDRYDPVPTETDKEHKIGLGQYVIKEGTRTKEEMEAYSALILPADVSAGTLFFYVLQDNKCYEIPKQNIKFEAGKSYKVTLDLSETSATITELTTEEIILSGNIYSTYFRTLSTPAEWRHAVYETVYRGAEGYGNYILKSDIDFKDATFFPIATDYLYGNNKTIKNISLDWSDEDNVGLVRGGNKVTDLTLENVSFKGNNYVGAFGGKNISVINCKLTGNSSVIGSGDYVGGIVGYEFFGNGEGGNFYSQSNIEVSETCTISGRNYVGGILGGNDESTNHLYSSVVLMESCTSVATVTASGDYVGGIFGALSGNIGSFSSDTQTFSLTKCVNKGTVTGKNYVGGIGGNFGVATSAGGIDRVVLKQSANEGNVSGESYVGGIVGRSTASINTCYSIGELSASTSHIGGIVGKTNIHHYTIKVRIANCYSMANITVGTGGVAGGIAGYTDYYIGLEGEAISRANILNSYFAGTNTTGCGIVGSSAGLCNISNCLTTLSSLGNLNVDATENADVVTSSEANVTSIKDKKAIINGDAVYSDEVWANYSCDCLKFMTGISGTIGAPSFGDEEIEI